MAEELPFHKRILLERLYHMRKFGYPTKVTQCREHSSYVCLACSVTTQQTAPKQVWTMPHTLWRKQRLTCCFQCLVRTWRMSRDTASPERYVKLIYGCKLPPERYVRDTL